MITYIASIFKVKKDKEHSEGIQEIQHNIEYVYKEDSAELTNYIHRRNSERWELQRLEIERQKLIFPFSFRKKGIRRGK